LELIRDHPEYCWLSMTHDGFTWLLTFKGHDLEGLCDKQNDNKKSKRKNEGKKARMRRRKRLRRRQTTNDEKQK